MAWLANPVQELRESVCKRAHRSSVKSALSSLSFLIIISVIIGLIVSIVIIVIIVITAPIVIVVMRRISIMIHDPTVIIIIRTMQVFMLSRGPMVIGEIGSRGIKSCSALRGLDVPRLSHHCLTI